MTAPQSHAMSLETARQIAQGDPLARKIGFDLLELTAHTATARMTVQPEFIAPNNFMHATISTLFADLTCGFGTAAALSAPGASFATLEIQTHHLSTVKEGTLICKATARHVGSKTQVWDGEVMIEGSDRVITLFRCAQVVIQA